MKPKSSFDFIIGLIAGFFFILNTLLVSAIIFLLFPLGRIIPHEHFQKKCVDFTHYCITLWTDVNHMIMSLTTKTQIEIDGVEDLQKNEWYLVTSNHRSWVDTCILYEVFNRKIPFLRFLAKRELLWFPFIGQSCWLLGFPFVKRYNKKRLKKCPELKGRDLKATQKACEKFKATPTAIMTFVEGTRYSPEKAKKQQSPYKHLLKPRAGGMAFVLCSLRDYIHQHLDVTIVYPDDCYTLWDFFCGRIKRIVVRIQKRNITSDFVGDYQNDIAFREKFQSSLNQLWAEKDQLIDDIVSEHKESKAKTSKHHTA